MPANGDAWSRGDPSRPGGAPVPLPAVGPRGRTELPARDTTRSLGRYDAYQPAELAAGVHEPLLAARVNADIGAAQRATILSVEGFLFSIAMVRAFPLVGWVAGRFGWLAAYAGAGASCCRCWRPG